MSVTFQETVVLSKLECCRCGVTFAIPQKLEAERRKDHDEFYCPNGHKQHFPGESEAERYKRLFESEQRQVSALRVDKLAAERARDRVARDIKRLKKRSAAGVCPCCNRTFSQLARHMTDKHQEFLQLQGVTPPKALTGEVLPKEGVE